MGIEIERKFLVKNDQWRILGEGKLYRQGYLSTDIERTVRVRTVDKKGFLTIKGITENARREEFEYEIPFEEAKWMMDELCKPPLIEKTRYRITDKNLVWEVDEFWGENEGLIIAEVELRDINQTICIPDWIGKEVTENPVYYNANLVKHPYSQWKNKTFGKT
jgi:CYTH domain-containing protein